MDLCRFYRENHTYKLIICDLHANRGVINLEELHIEWSEVERGRENNFLGLYDQGFPDELACLTERTEPKRHQVLCTMSRSRFGSHPSETTFHCRSRVLGSFLKGVKHWGNSHVITTSHCIGQIRIRFVTWLSSTLQKRINQRRCLSFPTFPTSSAISYI